MYIVLSIIIAVLGFTMVTIQPFGFPVTESAHSKSPAARGRSLGCIYTFSRTLQ